MGRASLTTAGVLGVAMLTAVAAPASASGGWDSAIPIALAHPGEHLAVQDISANGRNIAVAWQVQPAVGSRWIGVGWSTDGGASFPHELALDPHVQREAQLDICGGGIWVASRFRAGDDWLIGLDRLGLTSSAHAEELVTLSGTSRAPDVSCAGRRLAVAWFQRVSGTWRVKLRATDAADVMDPVPTFKADLGKGVPSRGLSIAATADRIYVAWYQGSSLKLRRYAIGSGPSAKVTYLGTTTITSATNGVTPQLAAAGDRVALAYAAHGGSTYVRVSTNRGASWRAPRRLATAGFEMWSYPGKVDIRGSRIIVALSQQWVGDGVGDVVQSTNDGATWKRVAGAERAHGDMVGALASWSGRTRVVQAWDQSFTMPASEGVRFRRQQ